MDQSNNDVKATTVDLTGITGRLYRRSVAGAAHAAEGGCQRAAEGGLPGGSAG